MNRALDSIKYAMAIAAIFILMGLICSGLWALFEIVTSHTASIFALAGY